MPLFGIQPPGLVQTIFEDIGVAVLVVDSEDRLVFANRTALQLLDSTTAVEGTRFQDLREQFRWEDSSGREIPISESFVFRALRSERVDSQQVRLIKPNGELRWLKVYAYRFCTMGIGGVVALATDETTEVEALKTAAQLQHMETLGSLAAGLTPYLDNVLSTIVANVALAEQSGGYSQQVAIRLDQISDAVSRATELIRRLMQFSRSQHLHSHTLGVNDLIRDVRCLIGPLVRRNIKVNLDLAGDLPAVYGDSSQIEQVLVNLVMNAQDAMPNGGNLTIATHVASPNQTAPGQEEPTRQKNGQVVEISVTDSGIGIPIEIQSTIFEPFFTTKAEGTGLGLASAYGIIRQHGGKIEVNSSPGKGATFTVSLPATA